MTLVVDNSAPASAPSGYRRSYRRRRPTYRRYRRRRSYRRPVRRSTRRVRRMYPTAVPRFVAAQIDPFSTAADGVKIPDSNTYPSTSLRVDDSTAGIQTDANGLVARAFNAHPCNYLVSHTAATTSTWTWSAAYGGAANSSRQTALAASYGLHRTCAHGVRITCPGAPTAVTGNVHVAILATSCFGKTTWNLPTSISELSNAMFYRKYPLAQLTQQPLTVVNKFLDCTSQRYVDINTDAIDNASDTQLHSSGFGTILVVVEGAPAATTVLSVENVLHIEAIPLAVSVDNGSPAAAFNVETLQTVSRMAGQIPGAFTDADHSSYMSQVGEALNAGASRAGRNLFNNFVIPAAQYAGYAATTYAAHRTMGIPGVTNFRNPSAFERIM